MNNRDRFLNKTDYYVFLLILLDILYFPYVFHLPIKISMILLVFYPSLVGKRGYHIGSVKTTLFFAIIGLFSVLIGLKKGTASMSLIMTNVQALIVIIYGYWIYIYFIDLIKRTGFDITSSLLLYLSITCLFAIIYWVRPTLFFSIRPFWTLQRTGEVFNSYSENRFSFLLSEPNNFAASINGIMAYLILGDTVSKKERIVISVVSFFLVVSSQSISGTVVFLALQIFFIFLNRKRDIKTTTISKFRKYLIYFFLLACVVIVGYVVLNIDKIMKMDLLKSATGRYDLYFNESGNDITGKRKDIWIETIQNHNFFKYIILGDASIGKPHSGNLFILYAFGLVFLCRFLRIFIFDNLKTKRAIVIRAVFFVVFSTNTLVVDLRSFTLWAILLALTQLEFGDSYYQGGRIGKRITFFHRSNLQRR